MSRTGRMTRFDCSTGALLAITVKLTGWHTTVMGVQSFSRAEPRGAAAEALAYRLDVHGVDVDDVVKWAGGWLYDRAAAGWDVRVTLRDEGDRRPLRILGVGFRDDAEGPVPSALAASARALAANPVLYADLTAALRRGRVEVTLWGDDDRIATAARGALPAYHVLSSAAKVFKAQALAAAGLDAAPGQAESFRAGNRSLLPVPSDLRPV